MAGEVIGAKHRQHAVRTMAQRGCPVGHFGVLLAGTGVVGLYRNGDFVDHRGDFRCRFPARLAGFAGNDPGQLLLIGFQQRGKFLNDGLTRTEGQLCPAREGRTRRPARLFNLRGIGIGPLP